MMAALLWYDGRQWNGDDVDSTNRFQEKEGGKIKSLIHSFSDGITFFSLSSTSYIITTSFETVLKAIWVRKLFIIWLWLLCKFSTVAASISRTRQRDRKQFFSCVGGKMRGKYSRTRISVMSLTHNKFKLGNVSLVEHDVCWTLKQVLFGF